MLLQYCAFLLFPHTVWLWIIIEQKSKWKADGEWGKPEWGRRSRKNVEVDKEGKNVCAVGNNKKDSERECIFILIWPCLCLCTASWKDEFAAVIYIYEFMPFGPVWNDGSFLRNKKSWCWIYNHPHQLALLLPLPILLLFSLLHMPGSAEYGWRDGKRREGRRCRERERERTFLSLRLLLSPVSHLRRCGTRINDIQLHGEIAAGSVCLSTCVCVCADYMCAAGEVQDSILWESQSVNMHIHSLAEDGQWLNKSVFPQKE